MTHFDSLFTSLAVNDMLTKSSLLQTKTKTREGGRAAARWLARDARDTARPVVNPGVIAAFISLACINLGVRCAWKPRRQIAIYVM
jgi:hypothetical protein